MSLEVRRDAERRGLTRGYVGAIYSHGPSGGGVRPSLEERRQYVVFGDVQGAICQGPGQRLGATVSKQLPTALRGCGFINEPDTACRPPYWRRVALEAMRSQFHLAGDRAILWEELGSRMQKDWCARPLAPWMALLWGLRCVGRCHFACTVRQLSRFG